MAFYGTVALLAAVLIVQACTSREVVPVIIGSVSVAPPEASLVEGESLQFSAVIVDDRGGTVSGVCQWSSDDPTILTISSDGIAQALKEGQVTIRCEILGVRGQAIVTVSRGGEIGVNPSTLQFFANPGGSAPPPKTVTVTNAGGRVVSGLGVQIEYSSGTSWLTATLAATTAPTTLTVTAQTQALPVGEYGATVRLTSPDAGSVLIPVSLSVSSITVVESGGSTRVDEAGAVTDSFVVALDVRPASNVVLRVTSADPAEATVNPTSLTFTPANWSTPRSVTVRGQDDLVDDGDVVIDVTIAVDDAVSDDAFDLIPDLSVPVTVVDNGAAIIVTESNGSSQVDESGTQDDILVVLNSAPSSNVVLNVTSGDVGEVTVSPATLTFTPANWSLPRSVLLTGVNDPLIDGPQTTNVSFAVNGGASDNRYDPVATVAVQVTTTDNDTGGILITESGGNTQVTEASGAGRTDSITVVLTAQPTSNVRLNVTNGAPAQVTLDKSTLTFTSASWSTPQRVVVTGVNDAVDDGDVVVPVTFSVDDAQSDDLFDPVPDQVVSVTTIDNDGAEFVLAGTAGLSVSEAGGSPDVFTVVLSTQPQANVRLTISSADTEEVNVAPASVTFSTVDWDQPQSITLFGVDDNIDDGNVLTTVTVRVDTLQASPEYRGLAPKTVTVTTVDNDAAVVTLIPDKTSLSETGADNPATLTASLSVPSVQTVTVNLGFTGTATLTSDYTRSGTSIVIPAMSTSGSVRIDAATDIIDEPNETVIVDITTVSNAAESGAQQATVTIVDDDDPPTVVIGDIAVTEGDSPSTVGANFNVLLSAQSAFTVTVRYATVAGGTATAGSDYTAVGAPVMLTFLPGVVSQTASVVVRGDNSDEPGETFNVELSSPTNATIVDGTGVGTINDDDDPPTLSIGNAPVTEGDSPSTVNANFTVTLSAPSGFPVTVQYATSGGGSATPGADYTAVSPTTLTFAPGDVSETATVVVQGDNVYEANETFDVTLSNPSNATIADGTGVGTINDDDPAPTVSIDNVTLAEGNPPGETTFGFTVSLSAVSSQIVAVNYATADGSATTADSDYTGIGSTQLTFTPGQTSQPVNVTVQRDTKAEANETFTVSLSSPSNATIADGTGLGTITNDDAAPTLSIDDVTLDEGSPSGTTIFGFTVTLSAASGQTVTVNYATANGSATTGDSDYTGIGSTQLTFTPGQTSRPVNVTVQRDVKFELDETFNVNLSTPTNATIADGTGLGTITNDDTVPTVTLSVNKANLAESGGDNPATVTATLSGTSSQAVTVDLDFTGTATLTSDYTRSDTEIVIPALSTSGFITIDAVNDAEDDLDDLESVIIDITGVTNGTESGTQQVTVTITDDDAAGIQVSSPSGPTTESGGTATFTVVLTSRPTANVTIAVTSNNEEEGVVTTPSTGVLTFTPNSGSNAWNTLHTVVVAGQDDGIADGNVGYLITTDPAVSGDANYSSLNAADVAMTNQDNEPAPSVTLAVNKASLAEGGADNPATVTATLSSPSIQAVTVNLGFTGTATLTSDYTRSGTQIVIPALSTSGSVTISAANDGVDEPSETVIVDITGVTNGTESGTQQVTVTIADDDPTPTVTLAVNKASLAEGGGDNPATVTATLSGTSSQAVTVNLGFTGTATLTSDYARSGTQIVIPALSTSGSVTISAVQDLVDEDPDETVIVDITGVTNGTESGTQQVTVTILDDDLTPTVTLAVNKASLAEGGADNPATVTATLSGTSSQAVTVNLGFTGTATLTSDYTRSGTQIVIAALSTSGSVTIGAVQDPIDEDPDETVVVDITGVTNGTESGTQQVTVTIEDDDVPLVTLAVNKASLAEDGADNPATVTATLSGASSQSVTVNLGFTGTATLTSDYTRSGTQIVIPALSTSGSVTISAADDGVDEPNETVIVDITGVTNGTESGTQQATVTVVDDDPTPTVTLAVNKASLAEDGTDNPATVTATLSGTSSQTVTVNLGFTGTATLTSDYTRSGTQIVIPALSTSGSVTIGAVQDPVDEDPDETVVVDITGVTNGTESGTQQATVTIGDDDPTPTVTLAVNKTSLAEGGADNPATVTATLSGTSSQAVTVDLDFTGAAAVTDDYTRSDIQIVIPAGSSTGTMTISALEDAIDEDPNEAVVVDITGVTNGTESGTQQVTVTIVDDDP
jgi:hypothetical protein